MENVSLIFTDINNDGIMEAQSSDMKKENEASGYKPGKAIVPRTRWHSNQRDQVDVEYKRLANTKPRITLHRLLLQGRKGIAVRVLFGLLIFLIGLIIGYVIRKGRFKLNVESTSSLESINNEYWNFDVKLMIRDLIKEFSSTVHLTGTKDNTKVAHRLYNNFKSYGKYSPIVQYKNYTVLVSYLDYTTTNEVNIVNSTGQTVYSCIYRGPNDHHHVEFTPYAAWSNSGNVRAAIIYVNFGSDDDFLQLRNRNVTCNNRIALMRYKPHYNVARMIKNAEFYNCLGVLIYGDPDEYNDYSKDVYPLTKNRPGWDVERTSLSYTIGDLTTPLLPAKLDAYHLSINDTQEFHPSIPIQPISYDDAKNIFSSMSNTIYSQQSLPASFIGRLNVSYNIETTTNNTVEMKINNIKIWKNISNVVAIFTGTIEPDRYIVVGSHYDSWVNGAIDPISGCAILQVLARTLTDLKKKGWKPKRTIMLIHWDATEQGFFGSVELVEEWLKSLQNNVILYIDINLPIIGNYTLRATADSILKQLIWDSVKETKPLYEMWSKFGHPIQESDRIRPPIWKLEFNSDLTAFVLLAGIPSCKFQFIAEDETSQHAEFSAFHSASDTYLYLNKFIDPTFQFHVYYARLIRRIILTVGKENKLPLSVSEFAEFLNEEYLELKMNIESKENLQRNFQLNSLHTAITNFVQAAERLQLEVESTNEKELMKIRRLNDKIMQVSRAFIWHENIPGEIKGQRNCLYGRTVLGNSIFPGIVQTLKDYEFDSSESKAQIVRRQIYIVVYSIRTAENLIKIDFQ